MSEYQESTVQTTTATPRWVGLSIGVLGAIALAGVGVGWTALNNAKNLEQSTAAAQKQQNDVLSARLAKEDDQNQQLQSDLKVVTDKLNLTQEQLLSARKQSKAAVVAYDKKLNGLQTDVNTQLATKASSADVTKLGGDVQGVRSDLDDTKGKLERATGDMGVMSGLIATNSKDLQALRELGDRNYVEFKLSKTQPQKKIGDVVVAMRKSDPKHNRYTVAVTADDRLVEKKDKTINEPVQIYVHNSRQPYEIVVNQVNKDEIVGYLSEPKVTLARQ